MIIWAMRLYDSSCEGFFPWFLEMLEGLEQAADSTEKTGVRWVALSTFFFLLC